MHDTPRRPTNSAHVAHVPARLQAMWAELVRRRGVFCVDKIYIFEIAMKNCSKYPSPVKIRDVAGTPNLSFRLFSSSECGRFCIQKKLFSCYLVHTTIIRPFDTLFILALKIGGVLD